MGAGTAVFLRQNVSGSSLLFSAAILRALYRSAFLLCMMVPDPLSAVQIEWTIVQTETAAGAPSSSKTITCTASDALTRMSGPQETILIDYRGARIFRLDSTDSSCRVYRFGRPHADLPVAAWTVAPANDASAIRHISFGMHPALAQTMALPVLQFYGREFPLCQAEFSISRTLPGLPSSWASPQVIARYLNSIRFCGDSIPSACSNRWEGFRSPAAAFPPSARPPCRWSHRRR